MNREIKFRGIELETGIFRFGSYIAESEKCTETGREIVRHKIYDGLWREVAEETIGQYTGKKDIWGADLFEGDVVKSDYYEPDFTEVAVIGYLEDEMQFAFMDKINDLNGEQDAFRYGNIELIGNIHQNPELLK